MAYQTTGNYSFYVYPDNAGTDTFYDFRVNIAGTASGSNTEKMDRILFARETENINRRLYYVPLSNVGGVYVGSLYKDPPTNSQAFTSYDTDMRLIFSFPDNMDNTAYVNLQGIAQVPLQKYRADGSLANLSKYDVLVGHEYLFRFTSSNTFAMIGQQNPVGQNRSVTILATNLSLTDDNKPYQFLSCEGGTPGNREVTLPVLSNNNIEFSITNISNTYTITVKDRSSNTIGIIRPKNTEIFVSTGTGGAWYLKAKLPENIAVTKGDIITANATGLPSNVSAGGNNLYYLGSNTTNDFGMEWRQANHTELLSIGTNTHAQIDTHIGSFSNAVRSHVPYASTAGQLFVSSNATNNTPVALPAGTNDYFIVANSSNTSTGVSWRNYVKPRSANTTVTGVTSVSFDYGQYDQYNIILDTASANLTLTAPSTAVGGITAPTNGQKATIRIKNIYASPISVLVANGSANTYRAIGTTFPTTIGAGVTMYIGSIYNTEDSRWDCVAIATQEGV